MKVPISFCLTIVAFPLGLLMGMIQFQTPSDTAEACPCTVAII